MKNTIQKIEELASYYRREVVLSKYIRYRAEFEPGYLHQRAMLY